MKTLNQKDKAGQGLTLVVGYVLGNRMGEADSDRVLGSLSEVVAVRE